VLLLFVRRLNLQEKFTFIAWAEFVRDLALLDEAGFL
jgi:hypothetical protein